MLKQSTVLTVIALLALACTGPRGRMGAPGPPGMTGATGATGATGSPGQPGVAASPRPGASTTRWITLRDIMFDLDSAEIRPSEMSKISDVAAYVYQNPSYLIGIDGSTDLLRGTNRYNTVLSQRRISNVRDALILNGVSANQIETGPFGVERAKCNDSTEQCSQREGRVEVMGRSG